MAPMAMIRAAMLASSAHALMNLVLLPEEQYGNGGRCLDGSMAGYYYEAPPSGESNLWVINLEGGGACTNEADCKQRATTHLGSNTFLTPTTQSKGFYSSNPSANPDFYQGHHVDVPYCTGDLHGGQVVNTTAAQWGLYFSGHVNLKRIMQHLQETVPGLTHAREVLFTGGSAGGIGAILNCDWLQAWLPDNGIDAKVKCAPIAGWIPPGFTDDQSDPELPPSDWAHWSKGQAGGSFGPELFELYQTLLHRDCVEAHTESTAWKCGLASALYPFIKAPLYIMENQYDNVQMKNFGLKKSQYSTEKGKGYIAYWGRAMRDSTAQIMIHPFGKTGDGLYLPSCLGHGIASGTRLQGHSNVQGLGDWYYGRAGVPTVLVDDCKMDATGLPCNPTCDGVPHVGKDVLV